MTCELLHCCQFFKDNMQALPKTADYIREKLCLGDYEKCDRYIIFKNYRGRQVPPSFNPADAEAVEKVIRCLGNVARGTE